MSTHADGGPCSSALTYVSILTQSLLPHQNEKWNEKINPADIYINFIYNNIGHPHINQGGKTVMFSKTHCLAPWTLSGWSVELDHLENMTYKNVGPYGALF